MVYYINYDELGEVKPHYGSYHPLKQSIITGKQYSKVFETIEDANEYLNTNFNLEFEKEEEI